MNKYSEALLQAFRITAQNEISKLKYDKTVQSKILSIVDSSKGEYEVEYQNNRVTAYSLDFDKIYQKDESVLIKIPEGDPSNKIIIESSVDNESSLNSFKKSYVSVGKSFYMNSNQFALKAFSDKKEIEIPKLELTEKDKEEFDQNKTKCDCVQVKAKFQTRFFEKHNTGSYGLYIKFNTTEADTQYEVIFDTKDFNGDFYNFHQWVEQRKIIPIPHGMIDSIASIVFKCENFVQNTSENSRETKEDENILCKDIELTFMKINEITEDGYSLQLIIPDGNFYLGTKEETLSLKAQLFSNQIDISQRNGIKFYLYKANLSEISSWEEITGLTENKINEFLIKFSENDKYSVTYKVVATYKDYSLEKEITFYNSNNYNFAPIIKQKTRNENIILYLSSTEVNGDWYCLLDNGQYKQLDTEKNQITIKKENLLYDKLIVYCQIDNYVTSIKLTKPKSAEDVIITFAGKTTYKYDKNGAISTEDAYLNRELSANIEWKDEVAPSYTIRWYVGENEVHKEHVVPLNSMITEAWVDNNKNLLYHISEKYDKEKVNNTVQIKLVTTDNQVFTASKKIAFTKDGSQSEDGTSYTLKVIQKDGTLKRIEGLEENSQGVTFEAELYKNKVDISKENVHWEWKTIAGLTFKESFENKSGKTFFSKRSPIIVPDKNTTSCVFNLTAKFDNIVVSQDFGINIYENINEKSKYNISSIPNFIKYGSDGGNPSTSGGIFKYVYDDVEYFIEINIPDNIFGNKQKYQTIELGKPEEVIEKEIETEEKDEDGNIIKTKINVVKTIKEPKLYHTIVYGISKLNHEAINTWDGTTVDVTSDIILTPELGAGIKDGNDFTGFIIGSNSGNNNKVGIYGYSKSIQTFLLDENGIAKFGAGDNGIIIDGTTAKITGNDLIINLNNKEIYDKDNNLITDTSSLEKDTSVFDKNGNSAKIEDSYALYFKNNNFILDYMGKITAKSGNIGGWQLSQTPYELDSNKMTSCLKAGNTILYGDERGLIETDHIRIKNQGAELGFLGLIEGSDGSSTTKNIGIQGSSGKGIVLETSKIGSNNIRLTANSGIYLEANKININSNIEGSIDLLDSTIMINADQIGVIAGQMNFSSLTEYIQFLIANTGE